MINKDIIEKAVNRLKKRSANETYFFDQLKSPNWIDPLYEAGFFHDPPSPIKNGDMIAFHIWPQSRYLVRMASIAPDKVINILEKLPDTENIWVHTDVLDAASKMPPKSVQKLVEKEIKWINSKKHIHSFSTKSIAELLDHLVAGGQVSTAINFTRAVLAFRTDEKRTFSRSLIEDWYYEKILEKQIPKLVHLAGEEALKLICDLVEDGLRSEEQEEKTDVRDYSEIWRPAIEDDPQNHHHKDLKSSLVTSIRDNAASLLDTKKISIKKLVQLFEARGRTIFRRLAMYFLAMQPTQNIELIVPFLTDHSLFLDSSVWHEYYRLSEVAFKLLSTSQQSTILGWIEGGPDIAAHKETVKLVWGREPTEDETNKRIAHWKLLHLTPIKNDLTPEWKERYQSLLKIGKVSEHPDFLSYSTGVMTGPNPPLDSNAAASMDVGDLIKFLKEWKGSSDEFMGPSPEGMSRVLTAVVAENPEKYAVACNLFSEVDPTYVRGLISGLQQAAKKPLSFNWMPVLEFCKWIVEQPRAIDGRKPSKQLYEDPDWGYARSSVAQLLSAGLQMDIAIRIPYELRELCWQVLKPLTDDPDPSREQEIEYGDDYSPMHLSINTTRGDAFHALFRYIGWINANIGKTTGSNKKAQITFADVPEAQGVLDHHLNPQNDPAASIRAVYGQWMNTLVCFGREWVSANLNKLFPSEQKYHYLRDACWETFLICSQPHPEYFRLFEREYKRQIELVGRLPKKKRKHENPDTLLAYHLTAYYCQDVLSQELLEAFYAKTSVELRTEIIDYLGRSLTPDDDIADPILERIINLWKWRLSACKADRNSAPELTPYGWWLISDRFDEIWSLEQLKTVLELTKGKITPEYMVFEYLAAVAPRALEQAIDCLALVIEGDRESWSLHSHQKDIRTILKLCLESNNQSIIDMATQLIHKVGARGISYFRDLLPGHKKLASNNSE